MLRAVMQTQVGRSGGEDAATDAPGPHGISVRLYRNVVAALNRDLLRLAVDHPGMTDMSSRNRTTRMTDQIETAFAAAHAQVEQTVVGVGVTCDPQAQGVPGDVADNRKTTPVEYALTVHVDGHLRKPMRPERLPYREEVGSPADVTGPDPRHTLDALGVETYTDHGQKMLVVHRAYVKRHASSVKQHLTGRDMVHPHAEFTRKQVLGARREQGKRHITGDQPMDDLASGAVATDSKNSIRRTPLLCSKGRRMPRMFGGEHFKHRAGLAHPTADSPQRGRCPAPTGSRIDDRNDAAAHAQHPTSIVPRITVTAEPAMRTS